jgi:Major Facilitator Superfamily/Cyclic nucleotide-binding domain
MVLVAPVVLVRLDIVVARIQLVAGVGVAVLGMLLVRHFRSSFETGAAFAVNSHKTYSLPKIFPLFPWLSINAILTPVRSLRGRLGQSFAALRGVFANPALRRVQLAYAGSSVGAYANGVTVAVYAYEQGGATAVGVVTAVRQVIAAIVAPFAAGLSDKYPRERVMLASDLTRIVTVGVTTALVAMDGPSLAVYAVATVTTSLGTVFRPAEASLMPLLATSPEELTAANVSSSTFDSTGVFAGPAVAAFLLALQGPALAFGFVVVTFFWSAYFVARVHTPAGAKADDEDDAEEATSFISGFRTIAREPRLRLLIGLYAAQCVVSGALGVLVVAIALQLLGLGSAGVGLLQAACGVGSIAGAAVSLALISRARMAADFAIGLTLWGLPLVLVGAIPTAAVAALALGIVGVGNTIVDISAITLLQRTTPTEVSGRVFGVLESSTVGAFAVGALAAPALIGLFGVRGALLSVGAFLPVLSILRWRSLATIDAAAEIPEDRLAALRGVPFLDPLPLHTLEGLARRLIDVSLPAGTTLFERGDHGDRFYVLRDGELEIDLPGETKVERPPAFVGEIALLRDIPRTATVRARGDAKLWALERGDFLDAVGAHARSRASADEVAVARLGTATA